MLKLRLKKIGRKKHAIYRLIISESLKKRESKSIDEIGYYDPGIKKLIMRKYKVVKWITVGVKPTQTVLALLKKFSKGG